jgi:tRNA A-37 threonylcarbamoyl transferase component Bud32
MPEPKASEGSFTIDHVPSPSEVCEAMTLAPTEGVREQVPGYDLLGVLGRGGMGVVYKARHQRLNRVVALKMILAGGHASATELARFRTEAEVIARLGHPGIVQIYEVGEHNGLPYLALEFCAGGSLSAKLNGTPLPTDRAAALMEQLAHAIDAAHRQQVIHRDLKPGNVLLVADGAPKITDFGLAKKLDDTAGRTQTGAVLGTPSYMAPEQAGGRTRDIGPATDVYALGAILYECLTGRPPFKAAETLDTVFQVLTDEPVPPTRLQPKVPRDLETICLTCLHKEPAKRYASAAALAEDLRRFGAGEPIVARPVGLVERAVKWARRRPAAAGLLLALVLGTAVSSYFAVQASREAHHAQDSASIARHNEILAHQKEAQARDAEAEAHQEKQRAIEAREQIEAILARSLLRPLGHREGDPNDIELDALWELAESPNEQVRRLFFETALARPTAARQLRNRKELAVHAAVGLDPARRRWLEEMLLQRLREKTGDPKVRTDAALVALEIGRPGHELTPLAARQVVAAVIGETDLAARTTLAGALAAVVRRLGPAEALELARQLADALAAETNEPATAAPIRSLAALSSRLGPAEASALARQIAGALADETPFPARAALAKALAVVAARLDPAQAARLAGPAARQLADLLPRVQNLSWRSALAEALAALAVWMDPAEAARLSVATAGRLADALAKEVNLVARPHLAGALVALAAHLRPAEAAVLAQQLADALAKAPNVPTRTTLAGALATVVARMDPVEAAQLSATVAQQLADTLAGETETAARAALARSLKVVAAWMDSKDATALAQHLTEALRKEPANAVRAALAEALAVVAARVDSPEVVALARHLADTLPKASGTPLVRSTLAGTLAAVVERLNPAEAERLCTPAARQLAALLARQTAANSLVKAEMAEALTAVAARINSAEAAKLSAPAAKQLTDALAGETGPVARAALARALAAVAARVDATGATPLARQLAQALAGETAPATRATLARALGTVAVGLDSAEAATLAQQLAEVLARETVPATRTALARALTTVTARMDSAAAQQLVEALTKETNSEARSLLARALVETATRIDPAAAAPRAHLAALAVAGWTSMPVDVGTIAVLARAAEPLPCSFTTQQLVDLLKLPTCVGEAQATLLVQLANRYKRPFANVWGFVEWAQKNEPGLDFTAPPKRNPLR